MEKFKYPRTPHLPFSLGIADDDIKSNNQDLSNLLKAPIVITEKMDGENFTIHRDYCHARSLDSKGHESRNWVKKLWGEIRYQIDPSIKIVGENLFAKHSIGYNNLDSFFLVFSIMTKDTVLSWNDVCSITKDLGLHTVSIIASGIYSSAELQKIAFDVVKNGGEGIVIRNISEFRLSDFTKNVFKFVRKNHVNTDSHWMYNPVIPNSLKIKNGG